MLDDDPLDAAQLGRAEAKVTRQRDRGQPPRSVTPIWSKAV